MFPHQYLLLEQGGPGSSVHLSSAPLKQATATLTLQKKGKSLSYGIMAFLESATPIHYPSPQLVWIEVNCCGSIT